MRRDAKLGLALGMLVIGFAVAFCFPRQPPSAAWLSLEGPEPIADSELAFLPIRAYQPPPASAAPAKDPAPSPPSVAMAIAAPEPIVPVPVAPIITIPETTIPAVQLESSAAPRHEPVAAAMSVTEPAPQGPLTYQVQHGDTLTGIASKCLGSSRRYLEIFEANRHLLGSPHDLVVGMQLTIPPKAAPPEGEEVLPETLAPTLPPVPVRPAPLQSVEQPRELPLNAIQPLPWRHRQK